MLMKAYNTMLSADVSKSLSLHDITLFTTN